MKLFELLNSQKISRLARMSGKVLTSDRCAKWDGKGKIPLKVWVGRSLTLHQLGW